MYQDTVTIFNHYESRLGDMWYPTVIHGVNFQADKAAITAKYGFESNDKAVLGVHYERVGGQIFIDGKQYLPPKEWELQTNDKLSESVTFASGENGDFYMLGDFGSVEPVLDQDYTDGFFNYMNDSYDFVFAITSVAQYSVIPHFEIMGA